MLARDGTQTMVIARKLRRTLGATYQQAHRLGVSLGARSGSRRASVFSATIETRGCLICSPAIFPGSMSANIATGHCSRASQAHKGRSCVHQRGINKEEINSHARSPGMSKGELIIQLIKVALGVAIGVYFVWWSLEVLQRLPVR
jgi:hypothetical protein